MRVIPDLDQELLNFPPGVTAAMDANGASASEDGGGAGDNDTCLQLALEGEKLCKGGNCRDGVAFFEAALQVDDSNA